MTYLAFKIPESDEEPNKDFNTTEMKNFKEIDENKSENISENISTSQNYKFFQVALACYCLYLGMILTNWEWEITASAPVIAKLFQSGLIYLFYLWTLVAPAIFPDREF